MIARKGKERGGLDENSRKMVLLMPKYVWGCKSKLRWEKTERLGSEYLNNKGKCKEQEKHERTLQLSRKSVIRRKSKENLILSKLYYLLEYYRLIITTKNLYRYAYIVLLLFNARANQLIKSVYNKIRDSIMYKINLFF